MVQYGEEDLWGVVEGGPQGAGEGPETAPADGIPRTPPADGGPQIPPAGGGPYFEGCPPTPLVEEDQPTPLVDRGQPTPLVDGGQPTLLVDGLQLTPLVEEGLSLRTMVAWLKMFVVGDVSDGCLSWKAADPFVRHHSYLVFGSEKC